jgi:hypothetical protein
VSQRERPAPSGASLFEAAFGAKPAPAREAAPAATKPAGSSTFSAKAASDAAAARERDRDRDRDRERDRDRDKDASAPAAAPEPRRSLVDLIAFEEALPARLRRDPAHAKVLARGAPAKSFLRPDEPAAPDQDDGDRGRWDVLRLLSFAAPLELAQVRDVVAARFDDETQLELPVVVVAGELRPSFDEGQSLEIAAQIAQPLAASNKALAALVKQAEGATQSAWSASREMMTGLLRQIEQAANGTPGLPPRYLSGQLERALVEGRKYRKRVLFGGTRIRADLQFPSGVDVPIYLPESAGDLLPMLPSLPVVAAVELRPREDASESNAEALVALAVGRVVRRLAPKGA